MDVSVDVESDVAKMLIRMYEMPIGGEIIFRDKNGGEAEMAWRRVR